MKQNFSFWKPQFALQACSVSQVVHPSFPSFGEQLLSMEPTDCHICKACSQHYLICLRESVDLELARPTYPISCLLLHVPRRPLLLFLWLGSTVAPVERKVVMDGESDLYPGSTICREQ